MEIRKLKIENKTVLVSDNYDGKLTPAVQDHIPELQTLLKRVEDHNYVSKSRKENMEFNKDLKVGTGSMKSFKDEDGDFVCRYENSGISQPIQIDEDFEFEQVDNKEADDTVTLNTSNLWAKKGKGDKDVVVSAPKKKITKHPEINLPSPNCTIKKRAPCTAASKAYRKAVMIPAQCGGIFERISYVKKSTWVPSNRLDGDLRIAIINHNKLHGNRSKLEEDFSIKIEKNTVVMDDDFESLLRVVVGHK